MAKKKESEFGCGLAYCLGLFLCHSERHYKNPRIVDAESWFNASSDHLYELQIPDTLPRGLQKRLKTLQEKCLTWGHSFQKPLATSEDMEWAVAEAKALLMAIDKVQGVPVIKGSWE